MGFILTGLTLDINGIAPVSFRESQESVDGFDVGYTVMHISSQKEKAGNSSNINKIEQKEKSRIPTKEFGAFFLKTLDKISKIG